MGDQSHHDHDHDHDHDHHHDHDEEPGRFSRGQEDEPEDTPEKEHRGDFAEGQQAGHSSVHDPLRGDFAEGQEHSEEHASEGGPDFARGQDRDPE